MYAVQAFTTEQNIINKLYSCNVYVSILNEIMILIAYLGWNLIALSLIYRQNDSMMIKHYSGHWIETLCPHGTSVYMLK